MFSSLDKKVDDNMESRGIIYHNHINMVKKSAIETQGVFKITQVDKENPEMVVGYEGVKYPMTAILWHPEYQYLELKKGLPPTMAKQVQDSDTRAIYLAASKSLHDSALKNSNRPKLAPASKMATATSTGKSSI